MNRKLQATWSLGTTVICPAEVPEEDGSTACEAVIPSGAADLHLEVADDRRAVGSDVVTLVVLDTAATGGEISWDSTNSLSSADFSFVGEHSEDHAGWSISGAGDVDGDGLDDILVGAWANDQSGTVAGKAYLLMP